jgi:hypothetical protein
MATRRARRQAGRALQALCQQGDCHAAQSARRFLIGVGVATLVACSMFYFKAVTVKLLPFDNKSEVQVVADLPEGTSLEGTARVLEQASTAVSAPCPKSSRWRPMPALRRRSTSTVWCGIISCAQPEMGDLMITLLPKGDRSRSSHEIAVDLREKLKALPLPAGGSLKVVETPPGPPVLATLLAEIYGPDEATRQKTAAQVEAIFRSVPYIVDVDNSFGQPRPTLKLIPDRARLDHYGLSERQLFRQHRRADGCPGVGYAPRGADRDPLADRNGAGPVAAQLVCRAGRNPGRGHAGRAADFELGELVTARMEPGGQAIFRRDGRGATMVTAELAGPLRSADLWHAGGVQDAIRRTSTGKRTASQKPEVILQRPARGREQDIACCGTANGRSPG